MSFKPGDMVVEILGNYDNLVLEVLAAFNNRKHPTIFFEYDDTACDDLAEDFRFATPEEIAAGHRIDTPQLEVLEMVDVSPNCEVSEL